MSSFLDKTGLTKLWDLIKSYIDKNHPKYEILGNVDAPDIEIETPDFGGGESGSTYIPVVSSKEELETLSQSDKSLAVLMSEDTTTVDAETEVLDLYQATSDDIQSAAIDGLGFTMCNSIKGICIDDNMIIKPLDYINSVKISAVITSVEYSITNLSNAIELGFNVNSSGLIDNITINMLVSDNTNITTEIILATLDTDSGKFVVNEDLLNLVNNEILTFPDAKWIYMYNSDSGFDSANIPEEHLSNTKEAFKFLKTASLKYSVGIKSLLIKNDGEYEKFDSDLIKSIEIEHSSLTKLTSILNNLDMPTGSIVRICTPETITYDTNYGKFTAVSDGGNTYDASVVEKIELSYDSNITSSTCPMVMLTNNTIDQFMYFTWGWNDDTNKADLTLVHVENAEDTSNTNKTYILCENEVWNEDNVKLIDELLASGINILCMARVGSRYNLYGDDGAPIELASTIALSYLSSIKLYCNKTIIPEQIETYDKYSYGWEKTGASFSGGGSSSIPIIKTEKSTISISPNVYYKWMNNPTSLEITFDEPENADIINSYMFEFTTGESDCAVILPSTLIYANNNIPIFEANYTYQISVINNLATIGKFPVRNE